MDEQTMNTPRHEVAFKIDEQTIRKTDYGAILGAVYLDTGEKQFPTFQWDDFVLKLLTMWLQELSHFHPENGDDVVLDFMDGPFHVRVRAVQNNTSMQLDCIQRYADTEVVEITVMMQLDTLKQNLLDIARNVVRVCDAQNLTHDDLERLREVLVNAEAKF